MFNKINERNRKYKVKTSISITKALVAFAIVCLMFVLGKEPAAGGRLLLQFKGLTYAISSVAFLLAVFAAFISYYEYHGIGPQEGIIRRGPKHMDVVSLTFDDGPSPLYTPKILDILKEKNVKATFFLTGKHVEKYPQVAKRIFAEGHEIGNHTYSHREMVPITRKVAENQIVKAEKAIIDIVGVRPTLFRPPRGIYSNTIRKILVEKGYEIVLWTISSVDWRNLSPNKITKRIERFLHGGAIILFHDSGALVRREGASRVNTVKALPLVIDMLRENNYRIVTVGALTRIEEKDKSLSLTPEEA
jgi:peptidoglycan/xylan/chitin deacetylase (PgdA/CDA1 family)